MSAVRVFIVERPTRLDKAYGEMKTCSAALARKRLTHRVRKGSGDFRPLEGTIKVMTMYASKGLEFPVAAVVGGGKTEGQSEVDALEGARLAYVAATRATLNLIHVF